ncbi:MAG: rhodanese-like domain-containing protein [Rickettsiaceae bacterium]|nr:rhodanese-like domain-containing protein [Rickettsiaceae bacterium]
MKKYFFTMLLVLFFTMQSEAIESNNKIQDTNAAMKFFEDQLNFTAGPGSVKKVVQGKAEGVIIDLRKREHFAQGHIPGAINLPFDEWEGFEGQHTKFPGLSKDKINYVYCYELLCNLSQKAAKKFASLKYPVKEMKGGFETWKKHNKEHPNNYPIEK